MNAPVSEFHQQCSQCEHITLLGPMCESVPVWPQTPIIFVDGGAKWKSFLPGEFSYPTLSVGDGDSLGDHNLDVLLDTQKDYSDLEYALSILGKLPLQRLTLLGFLGGRRDHEWINFGVTAKFLRLHQQRQASFDDQVTLFSPGEYPLSFHGVFSLAYFEAANITITGEVDFPLQQITPIEPYSSHGLSNQAHGAFTVKSTAVTLCFWNRSV